MAPAKDRHAFLLRIPFTTQRFLKPAHINQTRMKILPTTLAILLLSTILFIHHDKAEAQRATDSMLFQMAEGYVRIADPGVLADTLSLLGDVNMPGRYIVPRNTKIHELLAFSRGPVQRRGTGRFVDWGHQRIEVTVQSPVPGSTARRQETFRFRYDQEYPPELTDMPLGNDYVVSVEVKQRPAFVDWVSVISSVVGATATTLIVIDRLSD